MIYELTISKPPTRYLELQEAAWQRDGSIADEGDAPEGGALHARLYEYISANGVTVREDIRSAFCLEFSATQIGYALRQLVKRGDLASTRYAVWAR